MILIKFIKIGKADENREKKQGGKHGKNGYWC